MKKLIPILLSVSGQVAVAFAVAAGLDMLDPGLFSGLIDERHTGRAQRFVLEDLRFCFILVFLASTGIAVLGSLIWLIYANLKVVRHPKEVPALSPFWVAITLIFGLATAALDSYLTGRFAYGLRSSYMTHVVILGLLSFIVFYYAATFFATRPTMRPAVLFRNRLFARSQA